MRFLTDFGDQAVVCPVALAAFLCLAWSGQSRVAVMWAAFVPATLFAVGVAKLTVAGCGPVIPAWLHLYSPSGHTASGALVYGSLAALPTGGTRSRWVGVVWATLFAVVLGFSRLRLGVHSPADVLVGGLIGVAGAGLLCAAVSRGRSRGTGLARPRTTFAAVAVALAITHGWHLNAENVVRGYSMVLWPFSVCGTMFGREGV